MQNKSPQATLNLDEIKNLFARLYPKAAVGLHNGDRTAKICLGPIESFTDSTGAKRALKADVKGRYGVVYVRVSTERQKSKRSEAATAEEIDLGLDEPAVSVAEIKKADTGYSETDQIERGVNYFVGRGEAFLIVTDSRLSGGWPWDEPSLIHDLYTAKAKRYDRVFRRLLLDDPRFADQRDSAEAYLAKRIERYVESVNLLEEDFEADYIRPERKKTRGRLSSGTAKTAQPPSFRPPNSRRRFPPPT